jgi:hypothetical protein
MVRQAHREDNSLKTLSLILSLSKDEAKISYFFSSVPVIERSVTGSH